MAFHLIRRTRFSDHLIRGCPVQLTGAACASLATLTALQSLDLRNHEELEEISLQQLSALTRLTDLRLANCRGLTNVGLKKLGALTALQCLQLTYSCSQPAWLELFTAGGDGRRCRKSNEKSPSSSFAGTRIST